MQPAPRVPVSTPAPPPPVARQARAPGQREGQGSTSLLPYLERARQACPHPAEPDA